ncbi:MAG: hypothetical protein R3Y63_09000 [Eubacteriales bacterium]
MIESLLLKQMTEDSLLSATLTKYGGEPSVFYQTAPPDEDSNWDEMCFPRLQFNLDFSYDPERNRAGVLTVDVFTCALNQSADGRNPDRILSERLEEIISGMFYTPKGGQTFSAVWQNSEAYVFKDESEVETFGITVTFDLIAFPKQETFSPDPIVGLQSWAKENFPSVKVIGLEDLPELWRPSDEEPALYWRMTGAEATREMFACTWYMGEFYGHISCDSLEERNRWARAISEGISGGYSLKLDDGSFLRIEKNLFRHDGNPLSEGQIALSGEFGVLSQRYTGVSSDIPLNNGHFTKKEECSIWNKNKLN